MATEAGFGAFLLVRLDCSAAGGVSSISLLTPSRKTECTCSSSEEEEEEDSSVESVGVDCGSFGELDSLCPPGKWVLRMVSRTMILTIFVGETSRLS